MNSTTIVAVAGIAGTLLAPVIAGRVQRSVIKTDRIIERRLDAYADLLEIAGYIRENAQTWASIPLADLPEPPTDRIRSMDARIRVVGSDRVLEATDRVAVLASRFLRDLFLARPREARVMESGEIDTAETMKARIDLGAIADEMTEAVKELESRIRAEMKK